jgi:hypothetical protein
MNNPIINQSLIELEQNLKNLSSAKSQVDLIANKSNDLVAIMTKLVSNIETIKTNYDSKGNYLESSLKQSVESFAQYLDTFKKDIDSKTKAALSNQVGATDQAVKNLKELTSQIDESKKEIDSLKFGAIMDKVNDDLKKLQSDVKGLQNEWVKKVNDLEGIIQKNNLLHVEANKKNFNIMAIGLILIIVIIVGLKFL